MWESHVVGLFKWEKKTNEELEEMRDDVIMPDYKEIHWIVGDSESSSIGRA